MRSIAKMLVLGFIVACGGAADEQARVQAPSPPPPAPTADATPAPAPAADTPAPAPKPSLKDKQLQAMATMASVFPDAPKIAALYAPDAVEWTAGSPETKGREAIQKEVQGFADKLIDMKSANVRIWIKGNQLVDEFVVVGTDKASGKPYGVDGVAIYTFNDDGLITSDHTYFDDLTMMKQTGAYKGQTPARPIAALPTGAVEVHVAKADAAEDANVAAVTAMNDAWVKNDKKAGLALMSDDVQFVDLGDPQTRDKKFMEDVWNVGQKAAKNISWKHPAYFGVEDFVIDEGEYSYTQAGAFHYEKVNIPNKGKTVTSHTLEVSQVKDGKVVKQWHWENYMESATQLGIGPAAAKPVQKVTKKPPSK
jgi:ketosteroid isomerase-like protein